MPEHLLFAFLNYLTDICQINYEGMKTKEQLFEEEHDEEYNPPGCAKSIIIALVGLLLSVGIIYGIIELIKIIK